MKENPKTKAAILDDIFSDDDPFGLLDVRAPVAKTSAEDRLLSSFTDIIAFAEAHAGRPPSLNGETMNEKLLATRLKAMREHDGHRSLLLPLDQHNVLQPEPEPEPETLDDIFADDMFSELEDDGPDLHSLKYVTNKTEQVKTTDHVASRKKCLDFARFEPLFKECQADLHNGKRQLTTFKNTQELAAGQFHVLKGVLLYIEEVGERHIRGKSGDYDARTRTIYENGTESDILLRSLASALYADGKRVTHHEDRVLDGMHGVDADDRASGYIYVLRSLSPDPRINEMRDLYKIGFSSGPIEDRIRGAAAQLTYLMAPVEIVDGWRCYNMHPRRLEGLLHTFFGAACLDLEVADRNGHFHTPREWFIAPLPIIRRAVELIISGEIVRYGFDVDRGAVVER